MKDRTARPFLTDIEEIRRRAREHVEKGAVTAAYKGDVQTASAEPVSADISRARVHRSSAPMRDEHSLT